MTDTLRDRIAGAVSLHEVYKAEEAVWQTNAEHLADVILALPGIAVVELPEPERPRVGRCIWLDGLVTVNFGDIDLGYRSISATDARDLAAALLAAADLAERDQ